jgi:uncharacterized membrane protein YhaH (DUF805 family)
MAHKAKTPRPTTLAYHKEQSAYRDPGLFKKKENVTITRERGGWAKFLWAPQGRVGLAEYWFISASLAIVGFGGWWLDKHYWGGADFFPNLPKGKLDFHAAPGPTVARILLYGLVAWTVLATTLKRFQDRGLPFWVMFLALTPAAGPPLVQMLSPLPSNLVLYLILGFTYLGPLWLIFQLFLQAGTLGENPYGQDPRET